MNLKITGLKPHASVEKFNLDYVLIHKGVYKALGDTYGDEVFVNFGFGCVLWICSERLEHIDKAVWAHTSFVRSDDKITIEVSN